MVLVAYRHGLRSAEVVTLRWDAVDFAHGRVHVFRVKAARNRSIRCLAANCGPCAGSNAGRIRHRPLYSRRSAVRRSRPRGFVRWSRGLGAAADLGFPVHPHMLRARMRFTLGALRGILDTARDLVVGDRPSQMWRIATNPDAMRSTRSESGRQLPVPLGGRDLARCLTQRSTGVRPSVEYF